MGISHMNALQASAAQAVADLNTTSKRHPEESYIGGVTKRFKDPDHVDPSEELSRQLQATNDGLPAS